MSAARKTDSSGSSVSRDDASTPGEGIHKCDTVPPPEGEDDAYSAPTKIGPLALVEQLMAQAEGMAGRFDSAPPPKSGERPLAARKPHTTDPPAFVIPPPAAIPRMYDEDEGDQLDPTSMSDHPQQSGGTKLIEVDVPKAAATVTSSAPPADVRTSEPPALASSPAPASHEAYLASFAPPPPSSGAGLVIAVCVAVTLGMAALYFIFLAA